MKSKRKNLLFYCLLMAFPIAQFCVFYIGVNINSILMAFQRIDVKNGTVTWTLDNIKNAFQMMTGSAEMIPIMQISLLSYLLLTAIGVPLGLFFSYYIYKKLPLSGAFRVILFLPSIMSAIVVATIFQFFFERAIPTIMLRFFNIEMLGLLENPSTRFATLIFYSVLLGFGTNVLMYTNGMNGISQEIVEASHLDGASTLQEFLHITMPGIYPTLSMYLFTGVAGIFTNQLNLYSFYGGSAPGSIQTYGYYFYVKTYGSKSMSEYPLLSAMGLLMTVVVVPVTLLVKRLLEKHGPKEE